MAEQELKERKAEGGIYCINENQHQNIVFQPSENLYLKIFSPGPTMVNHIVDFGYEGMSNTFSVNFVEKNDEMDL